MKNLTWTSPGRRGGNVHPSVGWVCCAGDFDQIYDNRMHLGQPISLPAGRNPGALVRTCTRASSRSRFEFKSGQSNRLRSLETRNRLTSIARVAVARSTSEFRNAAVPTQSPVAVIRIFVSSRSFTTERTSFLSLSTSNCIRHGDGL